MTNLLAVDTSGPACSVAVLRAGVLAAELFVQNGNTHSQHMMPMMEQALALAGLSPQELTGLCVVAGPGSFTGVRIGVSAVRALSLSLAVPVAPVDALEALAYRPFQGTICPILDARRGQVYAAAFSGGQRVLEDRAQALEAFLTELEGLPGPYLFVGDGVSAYGTAVRKALGEKADISSPASACLRASQAAMLALEGRVRFVPGTEVAPLYLRAPQAEREFESRRHG